MDDYSVYMNFTYVCQACGETVQVVDGEDKHVHPRQSLIVEGCNASTDLTTRVEQALADIESLNAIEEI